MKPSVPPAVRAVIDAAIEDALRRGESVSGCASRVIAELTRAGYRIEIAHAPLRVAKPDPTIARRAAIDVNLRPDPDPLNRLPRKDAA